jgi:hypothetical protein
MPCSLVMSTRRYISEDKIVDSRQVAISDLMKHTIFLAACGRPVIALVAGHDARSSGRYIPLSASALDSGNLRIYCSSQTMGLI